MAQSLAGVLNTLYSSFVTLYAGSTGTDSSPVLVTFGPPGQYQPSAIVAVMDVRATIERPTLGSARSREMKAEVDVVFSVYTPGGEEAQQTSTDSALALLATLETNLRTSPNERLSGAARDAWVSAANLTASIAVDPASNTPTGRVTEIPTTVTALIRY